MSYSIIESLINTAKTWPKSHLDDYIRNLEVQAADIKQLLYQLKVIQKAKQKEIDKKLRESGTRGGT